MPLQLFDLVSTLAGDFKYIERKRSSIGLSEIRHISLVDTGNLTRLEIRARRLKLKSKDGVLAWGITDRSTKSRWWQV